MAEKIIRTEAKTNLAKDNWAKAVGGLFIVSALLVFAMLISSCTEFIVPDGNLKNINILTIAAIVAIEVAAIAAVVFLSPLYLGYVKFTCLTAKGENPTIGEVFSFFSSSKEYFRGLHYSIAIISRYIEWGIVCAVPVAAYLFICAGLSNVYGNNNIIHIILNIICFLCIAVCAAVFFVVTRRYYCATYIFVTEGFELSPAECIRSSRRIMKGNIFKAVKLTLSFIPWFLLCFFVIPWIYVYPYYRTSLAVSAKWICRLSQSETV